MPTTEMTLDHNGAGVADYAVPLSDTLKRKRLDRGFDLADVARETRIPLRHLTALELGDFSNLPALAYATGFVRTYARYLGLDPDAAARQFKQETPQLETTVTATLPEMDSESRLPSRKVVLGSLAALGTIAAAFIAYAALKSDDEPTAVASDGSDATAEQAAQAAPVQAQPILSPTTAPPVGETVSPPPPPVDPALAATSTVPAVPAPGVITLPSANGPVLAGVPAVGLVLRAKEDSWIKVSDGGPVSLKIGILKAGETYSVPLVPNLRLQTGNAGGLDLIYNGRLMPALGAKGEVLRNKPLDPAQMFAATPATR
jgi:cytoskeleton protein RodZ